VKCVRRFPACCQGMFVNVLINPIHSVMCSYVPSAAGPGGRLVTGIVGLNPARGMDVCFFVSVLCYPV
jgi:hypothetical protein